MNKKKILAFCIFFSLTLTNFITYPISQNKFSNHFIKSSDSIITHHENFIVYDLENYTITWEINDPTHDIDAIITIKINNVLVFSSAFQDFVIFNAQIVEGNNNIIFTYQDGNGNSYVDYFTIFNNFSPVFSSLNPDPLSIIQNSGEIISWNIIDNSINNSYYQLFIDNELKEEKYVNNQININFSKFNLSLGNYNVGLKFFDGYSKYCETNFDLYINDLPKIEYNLSENYFIYNENNSTILFSVSDEIYFNFHYKIFIDNSILEEGILLNKKVIYNVPYQEEGRYDLVFQINDGLGGISSKKIILLYNPINFINKYSQLILSNSDNFDNSIVYNIKNTQMNEGFYEVYIDNELFINKRSYISSFTIDLSNLSFTTHSFLIIISSVIGKVDYNFFYIIPNSKPIFTESPSTSLINSSSFTLNWVIYDNTINENSKFSIYINNNLYKSIDPVVNLSFNILFTLNAGNYSIKVIFEDGFGEFVENSINISVFISSSKSFNPFPIIIIAFSVIGVIGIVVAIIVIIKKKKKKIIENTK